MENFRSRRKSGCFYCPVSPYIAWEWGLSFKECPLDSIQRDMKECGRCHLRGDKFPSSNRQSKRRRRKREQNKEKRNDN